MERLTEPRNFQEWGARAVRWHVLLVGALLVAVAGAELQLHWIEHVLGSVLVSTNAERPESGAIWEKGRKTQAARSTVERLAADREAYPAHGPQRRVLNEVVAYARPRPGRHAVRRAFPRALPEAAPGL